MRLAILLYTATIALRGVWMTLVTNTFNLEEQEVSEAVLGNQMNIRIVLLFFFLAPSMPFIGWRSRRNEFANLKECLLVPYGPRPVCYQGKGRGVAGML